jgi:hypothetical protein
MAGAIAMSQIEAVREAALGFAFSPTPAVSSAALVAVSQQSRGGAVSSKVVDRLVRMRRAGQTGAPLRIGLPAGEVGGRRPGCLGCATA